jgi:type IV secretory pathway VirB10-like protein
LNLKILSNALLHYTILQWTATTDKLIKFLFRAQNNRNPLLSVVALAFGIIALILVTIQCAKKEKPVKNTTAQQSNGHSVTIAQPTSEQHVVNPVPVVAISSPPLPPPRKSLDGNTPRAIRSDSIADMPDLIDQTLKNKPGNCN